ncbi:hypothetical protein [Mesorhizobium sp. YR577]|uniref:hypothetical protein n=1 Tax=Mesorhizobium sp. YR577 TaxID=1884373 RepID=UPI0008F1EF59|nr:hypothetical protein [Mesorhizobium sp. YR577]SFU09515.1 hypothetical protein SAMN05518861_112139 [Mesorhizobium sp. YR577]
MKTSFKNVPSIIHIANVVVGGPSGSMSRISTDAVPHIIEELSLWKRINVWKKTDWVEMTVKGAALCSAYFGNMAENGQTAESFTPFEGGLSDMHGKNLVWLLHKVGKLSEATKRAERDLTLVQIVPGLGLRGVRVSFEPLPAELVAANDNNDHRTLH